MTVGLFSFDGPMYCDVNGAYCNTTITSNMFSRYFSVVDKLYVIIRTIHLKKTYEEAKMEKLVLNGIRIIEIPNLNSIKGFLFDKTKYQNKIRNIVSKTDLIFVRLPSIISNMVVKEAIFLNKKYLAEVGGCAWDSYWNHSMIGKLVSPYMYLKERKSIKNALYVSYVTKEWLQKRYPTKGKKFAISNVHIDNTSNEVLLNRLEKIQKGKKVITIGTAAAVDVKYKGQEYVIRAIAKLNKKGYNIIYHLVGGGDKSRLENLAIRLGIEDNIIFKGLILHKDIFPWLNEIDLYIQPSKQEGLPRSLIEAMSQACPSIGSGTAGIPELIEEKYIFKKVKTKYIVNKIMDITKTKESLVESARTNFIKAKQYDFELLSNDRRVMFNSYKMEVTKNQDK